MKYVFLILTILLTSCFTAKVSKKTDIQTQIKTDTQNDLKAQVDSSIEVKTTITEGFGEAVNPGIDESNATYIDISKPCDTTLKNGVNYFHEGKLRIAWLFSPATGKMNIHAQISPDTFKVPVFIKVVDSVSKHTSNIYSKKDTKVSVKAEVKKTFSASLTDQLQWWHYLILIICCIISFIIGRISKK